jgi:hypothetical protein
MTLTAENASSWESTAPGSAGRPGGPPAQRPPRLDVRGARLALDVIAGGWAVAVLVGLFSYRGASPGFLLGAVLLTAGLLLLARAAGDQRVSLVALATAAVGGIGVVAAVVALACALAGSAGGVRAGDAVVLAALIAGACGVAASFAQLAEGLGHRRLCLRWRRAGAVVLFAVFVAVVVAVVAVVAGRPGAHVGFWRAPFGRELPTPVPQVLLAVVGAAIGAAALALALAVEATRSWLSRLAAR